MIANAQTMRPHSLSLCDLPSDGPDASLARSVAAVDLPRIEAAVRQILEAVGENPDREGLRDTPRRVAKAYAEMFAGLRQSPAAHLRRSFEHATDQPVVVRGIPFFSLCEHHLLPFTGRAHVAYLPEAGRVVGLSKLARTVDVFARRPQMQERLTHQIADALVEHAHARGVAVLIEGEHHCMKMRGAMKDGAVMATSAFRGRIADDPTLRAEVLASMRQTAAPTGSTPPCC